MTPCLRGEVVGSTLEVCLCRPPHNAIDAQTLRELAEILDAAEADPAIHALLFYSDQRAGFSSGASLARMAEVLAAPQPAVAGWLAQAGALFRRLDQTPLLTVGALHGAVFGGGLEWALCLDVLVAERSTRLALPELRLGLLPGFGGLARLTRAAGSALARELLLTGRSLGARRAAELGVVSLVVPAGEGLPAARAAAAQGAAVDPVVRALAKRAVKPDLQAELAREQAALLELLALPAAAERLHAALRRTDPWSYLP